MPGSLFFKVSETQRNLKILDFHNYFFQIENITLDPNPNIQIIWIHNTAGTGYCFFIKIFVNFNFIRKYQYQLVPVPFCRLWKTCFKFGISKFQYKKISSIMWKIFEYPGTFLLLQEKKPLCPKTDSDDDCVMVTDCSFDDGLVENKVEIPLL